MGGNTSATAATQQCITGGATSVVQMVADTPRADLGRQAAYLRLLGAAFIDTDLMDPALRHSPKLWALLAKLAREMQTAHRGDGDASSTTLTRQNLVAFSAKVAVPLLEVYFSDGIDGLMVYMA